MRIRLLIERNQLPPASILWSIPPTQLSSTIAQFLESVNVRFPLEGNTWGLEDYTVTLGGYEAQHYTEVGQVFKEDDEVVIKPLQFAEARARTISGRAQITADGRRLVDGVPFGKPLLKRMRRPEVTIPPARKRARIEDGDEQALVRIEEFLDEADDEEDDEEDGDFEDVEDDEDAGMDDVEEDDSDSGDEETEEVEEANWNEASQLRMPIRSIYSNQCCRTGRHMALVWDEDNEHFFLIDSEDHVRQLGSDKLLTMGKNSVSRSWSTVDWTTDRTDHRAILKSSVSTILIEFKDESALSHCFVRFMATTDQKMTSAPVTEEDMQLEWRASRKILMAAHDKLKAQKAAMDDDDEEDDFESLSSDSSDSESDEEAMKKAPDVSADDSNSDSSDPDSSSDGFSSSGSADEAKVDDGSDDDDSDSSSDSSGSNVTWIGIEGSEPVTPGVPTLEQEPPPSAPQEGAPRTKERNVRRREAARLKHLKAAGEVPSNTTLVQMREWIQSGRLPPATPSARENQKKNSSNPSKEPDEVAQELEKKRQQLMDAIHGGGVDVSTPLPQLDKAAAASIPKNMAPPQAKKSKKTAKAATPTVDDDRPEELPIATEPVVVYPVVSSTPTVAAEESPAPVSQSAAAIQRRLDKATSSEKTTEGPSRVSAAHRLIYGSLGLKAPKTQADKDALQKKLADRSRKSAEQAPVEEQAAEDEDPEAWREKVTITAVECLDEGVELTEPPFPFQQKWDPQYWSQNVKKRNASGGGGSGGGGGGKAKKRKKGGLRGGEFVEVYDKYNQDGGGDALNYDDPVDEEDEEWDDGEDWEEGALLGADEADDQGFPALPEDTSTLPGLAEADAKPGDFLVFTEMACSDATGWQPQMITTIGCLDSKSDDGGWNVRFPTKRGEKQYDDDGNRVYKKFEMEGYDDDEEEHNVRSMEWAELMDPKLLLRPEAQEEQTAVVEKGDDAAIAHSEGVAEQIQSQLEGEMGKEASSADQ